MTKQRICDEKEALITYLYEDGDERERARFEAHLDECGECRAELETLRALRTGLAAWTPPERDLGFTIVRREVKAPPRWLVPALGFAAAALVLAASAAVANLEIRYGSDGLTVRAGRSPDRGAAPVSLTADDSRGRTAPETSGADAPWRAELTALERRLRDDFSGPRASTVLRPAQSTPTSTSSSMAAAAESAQLLRRVERLIAASEGRQQRELALRLAQVVRDFDRQRQTDLVKIQRGLGQIEGSAAENREVLNYLVRVSQQR